MKLFRWFLLVLLSVALPVQAASAAGFGLCRQPLGHLHANPSTEAAAAAATQPAVLASNGDGDCSEHHKHQGFVASADGSGNSTCSSCSGCCLGTAMPSRWQGWKAASMQQSPHVAPLTAYGAPTLRAPERPPRASAFSA